MELQQLRNGWQNAFYRGTACYVATLVTLIFCLQVFRYFFDLPSDTIFQKNECEIVQQNTNGQE